MEITSEKQNKVKRIKRTEESLRDLWDNIKHSNIWIIGALEEENKKGYKKILGDYIWIFPQHEKGNGQSSPRVAKSPIQHKPKEKHTKTHTNQINKI